MGDELQTDLQPDLKTDVNKYMNIGFLICVTSLLFSCGKLAQSPDPLISKPGVDPVTGNKLNSLSAAQKNDFMMFLQGMHRPEAAARVLGGVQDNSENSDTQLSYVVNSLQQKCGSTVTDSSNSFGMRKGVKLTNLGGQTCPLQVVVDMSEVKQQSTANITMSSRISIGDASLRTLNDVVKITLDGTGTHTVSGTNANTKDKASLNYIGSADSLTRGKIQISHIFKSQSEIINGDPDNLQIEESHEFKFSGYSVLLQKMVSKLSTKDQQQNYYLNGDKLSEDDYLQLTNFLGIQEDALNKL